VIRHFFQDTEEMTIWQERCASPPYGTGSCRDLAKKEPGKSLGLHRAPRGKKKYTRLHSFLQKIVIYGRLRHVIRHHRRHAIHRRRSWRGWEPRCLGIRHPSWTIHPSNQMMIRGFAPQMD
jgi:hypothetical protein